MSSIQLGRLQLGPPPQWFEAAGDPVTNLGGAAIPAPRQALRHQIDVATYAPDGASDGLADRLRIRRQLRSMLNNLPFKIQGYIYVQYSDDPEQNGWYIPDFGQIQDLEGSSGLATGVWKLAQVAWIMAGHRRINRESRNIWMRDLRTGLAWRDFLRAVASTDFSALPALALSVFPHGASAIANAVNGQVVPVVPLPTGRDGGVCGLATGQVDLATISYERPDSAWGLGDVIVYDRRGAGDAPAGGPGASWEEVYGPDFPWNWTVGGSADAPVLDNGLVRVRYDGTNTPGFRVDVWNGSSYLEQGKLLVYRNGDVNGYCDTWTAAALMEYTPDRAVVLVTLANSADSSSRERVYITLQRGARCVIFEVYPAQVAAGTQADVSLEWHVALQDVNDSAFKSDTQTLPAAAGTGVIAATAGTSSALFTGAPNGFAALGSVSYGTSENFVALLRCLSNYKTVYLYQATLAVIQAANAETFVANDSAGYGSDINYLTASSRNAAGYVQAQLAFSATTSNQVIEAEDIRNLGFGSVTQVADGTASGGLAVKETSGSNQSTLILGVTNLLLAKYRVWVRVKVDGGVTGKCNVQLGVNNGPVVSFTNTSWAWIDLSDVIMSTANHALSINSFVSAGAGGIYFDRLELFLVEDRTRVGAIYSGCRDIGQAALYDSRQLGSVVAR